MSGDDTHLAAAWRKAAGNPAVAADLDALFALVADQVALRGPACWASGRCCNFEAFGHRLYVTGLEAAWAVAQAPVSAEAVAAATARGGCPYQQVNLCSIHAVKPLACRVYFCDRAAQAWQQSLMERLMTEVRRVHDRHAVPYRYLEWRAALRLLAV